MVQITFELNDQSHPDLNSFTNEELNLMGKKLFVEWYKKTYVSCSDLNTVQNQGQSLDLEVMSSRLSTQLTTTMSTLMGSLNSNLEQISKTTKEPYGISKANKKGGVFEDAIEDIFFSTFPDYTYTNTSGQAHHGDGLLESPSGLKAIVEMKNYTNTVNSDQIAKLKYDLKHTGIAWGLMLSTNSSIQGRKSIDIESFDQDGSNYCIVYISHAYGEPHKLNTGISLLEHLFQISKSSKSDQTNLKTQISKLHELIETDLSQLSDLIDTFAQLKTRYLNMEKLFKDQLDGFYLHLRETEINLKQSIDKIWKRIDMQFVPLLSEPSSQVLSKLSGYKGFGILARIYEDVFEPGEIILVSSLEDPAQAIIFFQSKQLGIIKMVSIRVDIQFEFPDIKLSITDSNLTINSKLLKTILKDSKQKLV
jgi:hypothetical protein